MKKEELRIGNLIDIEGHIEPVSVYWLECMEEYPEEMRYYKGIPLRGKWLEAFGFEKLRKKVWGRYGGAWFYQIEKHPAYPEGYVLFIDVDGVSAPPSVFIKYVHELQNLYFALTGEELKRTESCKQ